MIDVETIELEGKKYIIVSETKINDITYMHLANINNPEDFCIRKVIMENGEEMIVGLDDKKEFEMALNIFLEKNRNDLEI